MVGAAYAEDFGDLVFHIKGAAEAGVAQVVARIGLMDQCSGYLPTITEGIAVANGEVGADVAVVAIGGPKGVTGEVLQSSAS